MRIVFDFDPDTYQLKVTIGNRRLSEEDGWRLMWAMEPVLEGAAPDADSDDPNDYTLATAERRHIERVLRTFPALSYGELAQLLGVSKKTLWSKRQQYDCEAPGTGKHRKALLLQQHLSTSPAE